MGRKLGRAVVGILLALLLLIMIFALLLFYPKTLPEGYHLRVGEGQGLSKVSRQLAADGAVYSREALLAGAYLFGSHNQLKQGNYRLQARMSAWDILQRLAAGKPDMVSVRIGEGWTFAQIRRAVSADADLQHNDRHLSAKAILHKIDAGSAAENLEGLLFPDTYFIADAANDMALYALAYRTMQERLQTVWDNRAENLPYQNPYELLIMASIIEKETGLAAERDLVAAVFVNRLKIGMRLQTDPSVIYGMGDAYQGNIRKADLQRDTPYNTYTRAGLPPTPIAAPSQASLEAAAHPAQVPYLYFVSKNNGSGESHFSSDLDEHNRAVRQYILKKNPS